MNIIIINVEGFMNMKDSGKEYVEWYEGKKVKEETLWLHYNLKYL